MDNETQNAFAAPNTPAQKTPPAKRRSVLNWVVELAVVVLTIGILVGMLLPSVRSSQSINSSKRTRCANNIRQLALAVLNYASAHGNLPPAFIADENGTPIHSWRQFITPYLDGVSSPPSKYTLDEPWNSPNNQQTEAEFKQFYGDAFFCPTQAKENRQSKTVLTNYRLVTGPGTIFLKNNPPKLSDIAGDPSQKIMLVEVSNLIPARQPTDISVEEALSLLAPKNDENTAGNHIGGFNVSMFDGSVRFVTFANDEATRAEYLQALKSAEPNDANLNLD